MMYGGMRLALAVTLLMLAGCAEATPRSQTRDGQPVAAPFVEIVCTEDGGTRLWTPVVEVQPDGVHLDIENRAGDQVSIDGLPLDLGPGRHKEVVSTPPGKRKIACNPFSQHGGSKKPVRYDLELVDPEDHWISTELECETDAIVASTSYAPEPIGDADPAEAVEEVIKGLKPDDVVELAGYLHADAPAVRIVRDSKVVGVVGFAEIDDGLGIEAASTCDSARLRW
jgi:hypothetical protein